MHYFSMENHQNRKPALIRNVKRVQIQDLPDKVATNDMISKERDNMSAEITEIEGVDMRVSAPP